MGKSSEARPEIDVLGSWLRESDSHGKPEGLAF